MLGELPRFAALSEFLGETFFVVGEIGKHLARPLDDHTAITVYPDGSHGTHKNFGREMERGLRVVYAVEHDSKPEEGFCVDYIDGTEFAIRDHEAFGREPVLLSFHKDNNNMDTDLINVTTGSGNTFTYRMSTVQSMVDQGTILVYRP